MFTLFVVAEEETTENDARFSQLSAQIADILTNQELGSFDGLETGPGETYMWFKATDADALLAVLTPILLSSGIEFGFAMIESKHNIQMIRIELKPASVSGQTPND